MLPERKENDTYTNRKGSNTWIIMLVLFLILILCIGEVTVWTLIRSSNRIDKSQLVGSWYIDGDDSPYFKLKDGVIIPGISEPPVRTLRATIPENERHIFR